MERTRVHQLRVVVEAADFDEAVVFFRDVLGLPETAAVAAGGDERVAILDVGRATLELATPSHKVAIDRVEAGGRPSPRIRLAFEVLDTAAETARLVDAGAALVAEPVLTPWRSVNSRLDAPAGLQITLFQETSERPRAGDRRGARQAAPASGARRGRAGSQEP